MARWKTATITGVASGLPSDPIKARGQGRSTRAAATRALLNLLKQPPFRRRNVVHVAIELSVVNTSRDQSTPAQRPIEPGPCESGG